MEITADGITNISTGAADDDEIMLLPSEMFIQPRDQAVQDNRNITERQKTLVLTPGARLRVLDQLEAGNLDYCLMKVTRLLPDGSDGALPENLAVFLQLDGFAQGGFESVYDPVSKTSQTGLTLATMSDLQLPEQTGMWYLTVDQAHTKVALFRGRHAYNRRIRLELQNTHASLNLHIDFIEIARRRVSALDGGSNARGGRNDHYGF